MARSIEDIKFNAVDYSTNDYVKYNDWCNKEGYRHCNESISKFLDEYFGYALLQYTGYKDKDDVEMYEDDKILIFIDDKPNIALIVSDSATFCFKFIEGELVKYDLLPISYVLLNVVKDNNIEVIENGVTFEMN